MGVSSEPDKPCEATEHGGGFAQTGAGALVVDANQIAGTPERCAGHEVPDVDIADRRCAGSLSAHRCRRVTVTRYRKGRRYDTMLCTSSTPYNRACWQEEQQP